MAVFVRDRNFYRTMLLIGVPVVLQSAITIGVNLMDTVMLAKLGEAQISASSLANQSYPKVSIHSMSPFAHIPLANYSKRQRLITTYLDLLTLPD